MEFKILNILDQLATTGRLKLEDQGNGVETLHSKTFGSWAGVVIGSFYIFRSERLVVFSVQVFYLLNSTEEDPHWF